MSVRLVISGCSGKMGVRIAELALADPASFTIAGAIEAAGSPVVGKDYGVVLGQKPLGVLVTDKPQDAFQQSDVLIEFSRPEATLEHLQMAWLLKKPMVIGTTGLSDAQRATLKEMASNIPVVFSPNMSLGVNVLFELTRLAAKKLGAGYTVELVEAHHKAKVDAPSGTAKRLIEVLAEVRKEPAEKIPCQSIREGEIVGDHTVIFSGPAERLELKHQAHSRDAFAQGALRAALFLKGRAPGLYDMSHVLQ